MGHLERVVFKVFFTQEYLDALSPRDRKMMEALMAAETRENLYAAIKRVCDEAEKKALEALNKAGILQSTRTPKIVLFPRTTK